MKIIYKNVGETPLEALDRLKMSEPSLKDERLSYAGRLDPMAEGLLLVMVGDENYERYKYLGLDKTYEAEIVFGMATDTFDALGKIVSEGDDVPLEKEKIEKFLEAMSGRLVWEYPPFSSKTVDGVPLIALARKGMVKELPKMEAELYKYSVTGFGKISNKELAQNIVEKIAKVKGDFRQEEITERWKRFFEKNGEREFYVLKVTLEVSSGFYVRALAEKLGKGVGTGAVLLSLKRTKIGEFNGTN